MMRHSPALDRSTAKRILIADPSVAAREMLRVSLEARGFDVLEARSGVEAMALVVTLHPDAVITEVLMPGMSGWEMAARLKAHPPSRDVVFLGLTTEKLESNLCRSIEPLFNRLLAKPASPGLLASTLKEMLQGEDRSGRTREGAREGGKNDDDPVRSSESAGQASEARGRKGA